MDETDSSCVICKNNSGDLTEVGSKGLRTLIHVCELRSQYDLGKYLTEQQSNSVKILVHKDCRRDFTNAKRIKTTVTTPPSVSTSQPSLRLTNEQFDWKSKCFFCSKLAQIDGKHRDRNEVHEVTTLPFKASVLRMCSTRNDNWGNDVKERVNHCIDFVAAEARYHGTCKTKFYSMGYVQDVCGSTPINKKVGRPVASSMESTFNRLCDWLETEVEL